MEGKLRLIKNKDHSFVWLVMGAVLILIGRDIFNLIPDFQLFNILRSVRIQILIVYTLISGYFWFSGWQKILGGEWPQLILATNLRENIGKLDKTVRWGITFIIALMPAFIIFLNCWKE